MLRILLLSCLVRQGLAQNASNETTTVASDPNATSPVTTTAAPTTTVAGGNPTTTVASNASDAGAVIADTGITVGMAADFGAEVTGSTCAGGDGWYGTVYTKGMVKAAESKAQTPITTTFSGANDKGKCDKNGKLYGGSDVKYAYCYGKATCTGMRCGCELYHPNTGVQFTCLTGSACTTEQGTHETAKKVTRRNLKSVDARSLSTQKNVETSVKLAVKTGALTAGTTAATIKSAVAAAMPTTKADFAELVKNTITGMSNADLDALKPPAGNTLSRADLISANANMTVTATKNPADNVVVGGATASAASAVLSIAAVFGALMA